MTLLVLDNSGDITLNVTGSNGTYIVSAKEGFTPGGAYRFTLGSGLTFEDKDDIIRNCEFTIYRDEIFQIQFNENLNYVHMNDISNMTQNGKSVEAITTSLYKLTTDGDEQITKDTGTFRLTSGTLGIGDVVAIYSGDKPVAGDDEEVLLMPDVLPVSITADKDGNPDNDSIMVTKDAFDYNNEKYAGVGLNGSTSVDKGDFISFYSGAYGNDATMKEYGRITSVSLAKEYYIVEYEDATIEDIEEALNYYSKNTIDAELLLEGVDVDSIEEGIEEQALDSGFAEQAGNYLLSTAMQTDGFNGAIDDFKADELSVALKDGSEISLAQLQNLGYNVTPVLIVNKAKANITTNGKHFGKDSLQLSLELGFTLTVFDKEHKGIQLKVSATFVEELKMDVNASGSTIVKWKWIFPYHQRHKVQLSLQRIRLMSSPRMV